MVLKSEWGFGTKNKLSDVNCIYFYEAEVCSWGNIMPEAGSWKHKIQVV